MSNPTLETVSNGISEALHKMIERANLFPQFAKRVLEPMYVQAQLDRWRTENKSDYSSGGGWAALDPQSRYAKTKPMRFAGYPGAGRKLMIAKNILQESATLRNDQGRVVTGETTYIVSTTVYYAEYADRSRSISQFSDKFYEDVRDKMTAYIHRGAT